MRTSRVLPAVSILLLALLVALGMRHARQQAAAAADPAGRQLAERLGRTIERFVGERIAAITTLAADYESPRLDDPAERDRHAHVLRDVYPEFATVEHVTAAGIVDHISPLAGNEAGLGLDVKRFPERYRLLERARETRQPQVSDLLDLVQGGEGIVVIVPISRGGFAAATVRPQTVVERAVRPVTGDLPLHIEDAGGRALLPADATAPETLLTELRIPVGSTEWRLRLPTLVSAGGADTRTYEGLLITLGLLLAAVVLVDSERGRRRQLQLEAQARDLAREHDRLSSLLDQIPALVVFAEGPGGRSLRVSRACAEITGMPPRADGDPRTWSSDYRLAAADGTPFPPGQDPLARSLLKGENCRDVELQVRKAAGDVVYLRGNSTPLRDAGGRIVGAVGAFHDVTELRAARRRAETLAAENARLLADLKKRRTEEQKALLDLSVEYLRVGTEPEMTGAVLERLLRLLAVEVGVVHLTCGDRLYLAAARGLEPGTATALASVPLAEAAWAQRPCGERGRLARAEFAAPALGLHAWASLPLRSGDRHLGVLTLASRDAARLDAEDLALVSTIANQLAHGLVRLRLLRRTEEQARRVTELNLLARELLEAPTAAEAARRSAARAIAICGAEAAGVYLAAPGASSLRLAAWAGPPCDCAASADCRELPWPDAARAGGSAADRPALLMLDEASGGRPIARLVAAGLPHVSALTLPSAAGIAGLVVLAGRTAPPLAADAPELVEALGQAIGAGIEAARLGEAERRRARDYRAICEIGAELEGERELPQVLERVVQRTRALFGADLAVISRLDAATGLAVWQAADGNRRIIPGAACEAEQGITRTLIRSGRTVIVDDVAAPGEDAPGYPLLRGEGIVSVAAEPIRQGGEIRGGLLLGYRARHAFSDVEVELLGIVARVASGCIEQARLLEASERRARWLEALERVDQALDECQDMRELLVVLLDKTCALTETAAGAAFLVNEADGSLKPAISHHVGTRIYARGAPDTPGRELAERVARSLSILEIPDLADPAWEADGAALRAAGFKCFLGAPLVVKGKLLGVLCLCGNGVREFSRDEVQFLGTLSVQAAVEVRNLRLYEETRDRLARLAALHEFATSARDAADESVVLRALCARAGALAGADGALVAVLNPEHRRLRCVEAVGVAAGLRGVEILVGSSALGRLLEAGAPVLLSAFPESGPTGAAPGTAAHLRELQSVIFVPLRGASDMHGAVAVGARLAGAFTARDAEFLETLAGMAGTAIERLRASAYIERRARELSATVERQGDFLRSVLESITDGVFATDDAGRVLEWNATLTRISGRPAAEALRQPLGSVLRLVDAGGAPVPFLPDPRAADGASVHARHVDGLLRPPSTGNEPNADTADAEAPGARALQVTLDLAPLLTAGGTPVGHVGIVRDVSRERALLDAISGANQAKSEFLSTMSHELRTPLNSIIGFTEMLEACFFGPLTAKQVDYVKNVLSSARHLLALINDILDYSNVDAGRMDLRIEDVPLPSALISIVDGTRPTAIRRQHTLACDLAPLSASVRADASKFRQIFHNLLSNAIKVTPPGGTITVAAHPLALPSARYPELVLR
ncbi:MAG: GAF domain-containing protein, partial [Planctomycetes bacterium]|nr:GAF domain-containing protein [Planctomycetota bacterium]